MPSTLRTERRRLEREAVYQSKADAAAGAKLAEWEVEAKRRSLSLKAPPVWDLFYDHLEEARLLNCVGDLRDMCAKYAVAHNPRAYKMTRHHYSQERLATASDPLCEKQQQEFAPYQQPPSDATQK